MVLLVASPFPVRFSTFGTGVSHSVMYQSDMSQQVILFGPGVRGQNLTVSYTTHPLTRAAGVDRSHEVIQMFRTLMLLFAKLTDVMLSCFVSPHFGARLSSIQTKGESAMIATVGHLGACASSYDLFLL